MRGSCWEEPSGHGAYALEAIFPDTTVVPEPEAALSRIINLALDAIEAKCSVAEGHRFYVGVHTTEEDHCCAYVRADLNRKTLIDQVLKTLYLDPRALWYSVFNDGILAMALVVPAVDVPGCAHTYPYDDVDYAQGMIHNLHLISPVNYHPFQQ